jgi:shikimate dehydrogenase
MTISGHAKLAGIAGWPIAHSLSPTLHGYWIAEHKLDAAYVPLAIQAEDFASALSLLPKLGFRGINVTLPHKEAAFRLTTEHDAAAIATGAVNTVVFENGRAHGRNTDVHGFLAMARDSGITSLASKTAVVLGAGGASRAVVASLLSLGAAKIHVVNRTPEKAHALARFFGERVSAADWNGMRGCLAQAAALVNTTSLGMKGEPPLDIDLTPLPAHSTVVDIVYRPLETPLLARAKARGLKTLDGLGMLLHQAQPGFAAWFGVEAKVTPQLRAHMVAALEARG